MNENNKKHLRRVTEKLKAAAVATAITAGAAVMTFPGTIVKTVERGKLKKEQKELQSQKAQAQAHTMRCFENLNHDDVSFLKENGYSITYPLDASEGISERLLEISDKDNKPVGAVVAVIKGKQAVGITSIHVLDNASDLLALMQKQSQWKEYGRRHVSVLENESLIDALNRESRLSNLSLKIESLSLMPTSRGHTR